MSFTCHDLFSEEGLPVIAKLYEDAVAVENDEENIVTGLQVFSQGLSVVMQSLAEEYGWSLDVMAYFLVAGCLGVNWTSNESVDPIEIIKKFKAMIETVQEDIEFKEIRFTQDKDVIKITPDHPEYEETIEWLTNMLLEMQEQLHKIQGVKNEIRSDKNRPDRQDQ